jgi:hypothetical protein
MTSASALPFPLTSCSKKTGIQCVIKDAEEVIECGKEIKSRGKHILIYCPGFLGKWALHVSSTQLHLRATPDRKFLEFGVVAIF